MSAGAARTEIRTPGRGPTAEQKKVLERRGSDNFVSAGAGSGKTSLLVDCYLRALLEDGLLPEDLPTVTFTRKAAAEMRSRIRHNLLVEGRADLARRLPSAPIGTIHSFCRRLLAANPVAARVDPGASVLDEEQAAILRHQVWREVWESRVVSASVTELEVLASFRRPLRGETPALYDRLRTLGEREPSYRLAEASDWKPTLAGLKRSTGTLARDAAAHADRSRVAETILRTSEQILAWAPLARPGRPALERSKEFMLPLNGPAALRPSVLEVRAALTAARQALAGDLLSQVARLVDSLLADFHAAYSERKRGLGSLDFQDLELEALGLLSQGPPPYGKRARLLVDEFQDTNELQCALFEKLGVGARLTVGDEFQSIYAFRGADVEVFRRLRDRQEAALSGGGLSSLRLNFRSRPALLEIINHIFSSEALFAGSFSELKPGRNGDEPRAGNQSERGALTPAMELLVLDKELAKARSEEAWQAAEARVAAERVSSLVEEEGWQYRDVVMLLAAFTHVQLYAQALEDAGIPAYVVGGRGYYAREEVSDVLALLRLLLNPHDDVALVTVLRSPLVGVLDDSLFLLRRSARRRKQTYLWQALNAPPLADLPHGEHAKLGLFAQRIAHLRRHIGAPGLAALIDEALSVFDYDLAVLAAPDGRRRFANLRKLMRLADEFEQMAGPDLPGLVSYLERRGDIAAREGNAAVLSEGENVVRVMTIHQAKGLEFPVVVVVGAGADVGRQEPRTFLVDTRGRKALMLKGSKASFEEFPLALGPAQALLEEAGRREAEELVRLYYVAFTRAEERLLVLGSTDHTGRSRSAFLRDLLSAVGMESAPEKVVRPLAGLDLVVKPIAPTESQRSPVGSPRREDSNSRSTSSEADRPPFDELPDAWSGDLGNRGGPRRVSFSSLNQYHSCPYRFYLERILGLRLALSSGEGTSGSVGSRLVSKAAATGAVSTDAETGLPQEEPLLPGGEDEVDGRFIGSLVHRCLELLPLTAEPSAEAVEAALDGLLAGAPEAMSPGLPSPVLERVEGVREGSHPLPLDARTEAVKLVKAFWRSTLAVTPELHLAEKEVPFLFSRGEVLVGGVIDLLVRQSGRWLVVDYKTNLLPQGGPQEAFLPYELQARIYALSALEAGAAEVRVAFVFLQQPGSPVEKIYTTADRPRLEEALDQALAGPLAGSYARYQGCSGCEQGSLCEALARGEDLWNQVPAAWTPPTRMV